MAGFRSHVWDPLLIICQITFLQSQFYVLLCLYLLLFTSIDHTQPTLAHVLSSKPLATWHHGWPIVLAYALSAVSGAFSLRYAIRRSKKCMDFTVTMFFLHAMLCWVTKGFPSTWQWWLLSVLTATAMVVLGEWLCLRMEVSEIPVAVGSSPASSKHSGVR